MTKFFPYFSRLRRNPAFLWKLPSNCHKLETNYRHHQKVMNCNIFSTKHAFRIFRSSSFVDMGKSNATYNTITQKLCNLLCTPNTNLRPEECFFNRFCFFEVAECNNVAWLFFEVMYRAGLKGRGAGAIFTGGSL